jgi:hypothetical protein
MFFKTTLDEIKKKTAPKIIQNVPPNKNKKNAKSAPPPL